MNLRFWSKKEAKTSTKTPGFISGNIRKFVKSVQTKAAMIAIGGFEDREGFSYPEYDLEEIKNAAATDSYIKYAIDRYSYLIFKAGYKLQSDNEKAKKYIDARFKIMAYATGAPIEITFQEVADDLVKYSNAFLLKARTENPIPGIKTKGVFHEKHVGGYYRIDPTTIKIKRKENGTIVKYVQVINGKEKKFSPRDVIHFYVDKEAGHAFGTPRIAPALEDVKLLRKVEGITVSMLYRFAIPLIQMIVGLKEQGQGATEAEIEEAERAIENMSLDGMLVTSERVDFRIVGADKHAVDSEKYLKYFEKRVFSALSMSGAQMGRGGSKQDADSMEALSHDIVKYIQRCIQINIENHVIGELLLEGGFNPLFKDDDRVNFVFHEISLETKTKLENHELSKFQSDIITFEEMRRNLGKDETVNEERLYSNILKEKGISLTTDSRQQAIKNEVKSKDQPKNQHKQRMAPKMKESAVSPYLKTPMENNRTVFDYKHVITSFLEHSTKEDLLEEIHHTMLPIYKQGYYSGMQEIQKELGKKGKLENIRENKHIKELKKEIQKTLDKIYKDIERKEAKDPQKDTIVIRETLRYRIDYLMEHISPKAFWIGYLYAGSKNNIKTAKVHFEKSDDEMEYPDEISTMNYNIKDIPAYHAFCGCQLKLEMTGEGR